MKVGVSRLGWTLACGSVLAIGSSARADAVTAGNTIVQGSLCVGLDCVKDESFGSDTIRLSENNLRIHFNDTSTGNFPANDWEIRINDSTSGGNNYFGVVDRTADKLLLRVDAGAPENALRVTSHGVYLSDSDSPFLRLSQTGTDTLPKFSWDITGNESNFFVRHDNILPFRIYPSATTDTLTLHSTGVGVGTNSPAAALHVRATQAVALKVESVSQGTTLLEVGDGGHRLNGVVTITGKTAIEGNLAVHGTISQTSSVHAKENFERVDGAEVLEHVAKLNVERWSYKSDPGSTPHIGPYAEEFHEAFQVGEDAQHIAPSDSAGVALVAVQALYRKVQEQEAELKELRARMAEYEARKPAPPASP
jgi:hypothetical protein